MKTVNDITIEAYEQNLESYINKTPQKISGEFKKWIDKAISRLQPTAIIIEIGVSFGRSADYIESKGFGVERTDAAKTFVNFQKKSGHEASVFNVLRDEFACKYDMVLAEAVLLHFNLLEMQLVIKKVFATLNPKAQFLFSVKQGDGERWEDSKLGKRRYFHFWQPSDIEDSLLKAGFRKFTIESIVDTRGGGKPNWLLVSATKEGNT